jgi:Carboxypeptidase regulatory-like domain/TonB-dependent Receptor Plug Domain
MRCRTWGVIVCLLISSALMAQKYTGTIRGVVTDPSGAVIPGVQVTVTNTGTGASRTATTGSAGEYVVPELTPGTYDVRFKQAHFKEFVSRGVELNVSSTSVINAALTMGSATEAITVEANAVQLETSTGAVGNVIEGNEVRELPLNGRSFAQLTQLMPGVSPAANFDSKHKGLEAGVDFSVNGNSTTGNIFLVDGVNNNDIGSNRTILVYPSIDAIQEFKILSNSYGPEYGQASGAVVNIVTRSGTNQFHGGAFYFGRNDLLNATDYFNNLNNLPKDKLRRNDFGYNFGGPILKDKLFFYWSQEWNRELRGKARSASVPTAAEQAGDFTNLRPGVDSNGNPCDPTPKNPTGGAVLTTVPAISPAGQLLVNLFPLPNVANPVNCKNWASSLTAPIYWREESIRADYKIGSTWSLMGRFTEDHWSQPFPSTLGFWGDDRYPSVESNWLQPGYQATIKLTKVFGSSAVNDFQVSYAANRITITRAGTNPALNDQIAAAFAPFFPLSQKFAGKQIGYPVFWGGLGPGANSDNLWTIAPWHNNEQLYVLKDDFSKVVGVHTFKVGFLVSNNQKNELVNASSAENAQFWGVNTGDTGNGVFNALWSGRQWGFSELQTNPFSQTRWHDIEPYFGDNWKVRRNITVEYGFRWSLLRNPYSAADKIASYNPRAFNPTLGSDPCNGILFVPGTNPCKALGFLGGSAGVNRSLKEENNHAFAPRLGIAWDPTGNGKTSIRAGLGQFFQRERLNNYLQLAANSPFSLTAGGTRGFDVAPAPGSLTASGSPGYGISGDSNLPNSWQWNLTVEHEIARNNKLQVAYVGNRGIHLLQFSDANAVPPSQRLNFALNNSNSVRPAPAFGFITFATWTGDANYHALQVLYRSRMKNLDAQFAYTWSKSLSDTDITNSGNNNRNSLLLDSGNPRFNYGPSQINRPHIFTASIVYDAPKLTGQNAFARGTLGGWELAAILDYASGSSMTAFAGRSADGASGGVSGTGANQDNARPLEVAGQPCRAPSGLFPKFQWLNPNRWTMVGYQLGSFGNASVGECLSPGIANTDFSIYKNFRIKERVTMQFRIEFYNLFNKAQFLGDAQDSNNINTTLSSKVLACTSTAAADKHSINNPSSACFGRPINTTVWDAINTRNSTFGQVTVDKGPREIQYALKFNF